VCEKRNVKVDSEGWYVTLQEGSPSVSPWISNGNGRVEKDLLVDGLLVDSIIRGLAHQPALGHTFLAAEPHENGPHAQGDVNCDVGFGPKRSHVSVSRQRTIGLSGHLRG
jgi:hypothetical protein